MRPSEVMRLFQGCGAWMEGHFVLSSGLHSREYLQCAMILQHPTLSARACQALSQRFLSDEVTCVAGPALGGILVAYETARQLGVRSVFAERKDGKLQMRRGFQVGPKDRVLVVEDVVTTGGSVEELISLIRGVGAEAVGVGALVDRSSGWASFEVKYHALLSLDLKTFSAEACPLCKEGIPIMRPGSRTRVP